MVEFQKFPALLYCITCLRIFCSLMSFCRSLLGLFTIISRTSCPLLGISTTKNTKSSRSFVTALKLFIIKNKLKKLTTRLPSSETIPNCCLRLCFLPPLVLRDSAFFQLSGNRGQHFTGIVCKIKVPHFSRGDGHNGERLFVLFMCRCANLESEIESIFFSYQRKSNFLGTLSWVQK